MSATFEGGMHIKQLKSNGDVQSPNEHPVTLQNPSVEHARGRLLRREGTGHGRGQGGLARRGHVTNHISGIAPRLLRQCAAVTKKWHATWQD
jgi:hypothetical protein